VRSLGLRSFVAFHIVRIAAGAWFLVLYRRGELPEEFAIAAGWGDIVVGVGAVAVCWFCFPLRTSAQRRVLLLWNLVGLIDIVGVLANGTRLFLRDPTLAEPFMRLPVALLPTFVVPIVIVSHVLIFVWARDAQERSY
jgi:cytochrome bd-type quinol oxidase subunit 2